MKNFKITFDTFYGFVSLVVQADNESAAAGVACAIEATYPDSSGYYIEELTDV